MRLIRLALVLGVTLAPPLIAQNPPTRALTKPDAEFPQSFISIGSVHELPDGRVIVGEVHRRDGSLQVVDFRTGTAVPVTRKGAGPGEFDGRPEQLLTFAGDTVAMYDGGNAGFLMISPDGKPARTAPFTPASWTIDLRWGDTHGHLYSEIPGRTSAENRVADSAFIVRLTLATGKLDTVAVRRVSATDVRSFSDGRIGGFRTAEVPFAVHDDWAALPDGRVAVVRGKDYHVDFIRADGTKYSGPAMKYQPIAVTKADKDSVIAARTPKPGPDGKVSTPKIPFIIEPSVWYPVKPPFGESSTFASPTGELWVAVSQPAGTKSAAFDVFNDKGVRTARVVLPPGSRLIELSARAVYTVRVDPDDQQFLQKFNWKR